MSLHATDRLRERFFADASRSDMLEIRALIEEGCATLLRAGPVPGGPYIAALHGRLEPGERHWALSFRGQSIVAVTKEDGTLATVRRVTHRDGAR